MGAQVDPTLAHAAAENGVWDVVIVGAGPAGSSAAIKLARANRRVLLLDRNHFPRNKVCGGCLNPAALEMLRDLGIGPEIKQHSTPLTRSFLYSDGQHAEMQLKETAFLPRVILDALLLQEAIRLGASFLDGTLAMSTGVDPTGRIVRAHRRSKELTLRCELLLAADGLGSEMASAGFVASNGPKLIGVGAEIYAPGVLLLNSVGMAISPEGYVGMVQLEDGTLHIAACVSVSRAARFSAADTVTRILARNDITLPLSRNTKWNGTPPLRRKSSSVASERMLLIGDSAGYTEPLTGEGIAWALASGIGAADLVTDSQDVWRPGLDIAWEKHYARLVGSRQRRSSWIGQWARGKRAAAILVGVCQRAPWLATRVMRHLGRAYKPGYARNT